MALRMGGYAKIVRGIHKQFPGCNYVVNSGNVWLAWGGGVAGSQGEEVINPGVDQLGDMNPPPPKLRVSD